MNSEDIAQIIRMQLADCGVTAVSNDFVVAEAYYAANGNLPDIDYILDNRVYNNESSELNPELAALAATNELIAAELAAIIMRDEIVARELAQDDVINDVIRDNTAPINTYSRNRAPITILQRHTDDSDNDNNSNNDNNSDNDDSDDNELHYIRTNSNSNSNSNRTYSASNRSPSPVSVRTNRITAMDTSSRSPSPPNRNNRTGINVFVQMVNRSYSISPDFVIDSRDASINNINSDGIENVTSRSSVIRSVSQSPQIDAINSPVPELGSPVVIRSSSNSRNYQSVRRSEARSEERSGSRSPPVRSYASNVRRMISIFEGPSSDSPVPRLHGLNVLVDAIRSASRSPPMVRATTSIANRNNSIGIAFGQTVPDETTSSESSPRQMRELGIDVNRLTDVTRVIKNIDEIPMAMPKNIKEDMTDTQCNMCYDTFVPTDLVRILPCKHIFHIRCIDNYLTTISYLCPYCKQASGASSLNNL